MVSAVDFNRFVGRNISDICGNGFADPNDNHCAHFVSNAMGYSFGYTCKIASRGKLPGVNLRVHEIFACCPTVGHWVDKPIALAACLVFVTNAGNVNVATKTMDNTPRKHIGVFIQGTIWHYSNSRQKVISQTPGELCITIPDRELPSFTVRPSDESPRRNPADWMFPLSCLQSHYGATPDRAHPGGVSKRCGFRSRRGAFA